MRLAECFRVENAVLVEGLTRDIRVAKCQVRLLRSIGKMRAHEEAADKKRTRAIAKSVSAQARHRHELLKPYFDEALAQEDERLRA